MSAPHQAELFLPGEAVPKEARPLPELPLLILVGLTGVGKTSLLKHLGYPTLPDRREIVDRYVLPRYGYNPATQLDRGQRFALTRRFRQEHPGGVAEILLESWARPTWPLILDGLRGAEEVGFALEKLPKSYFIVLEARDLTRLARLLQRDDRFDRVALGEDERAQVQRLAQGVLSPGELEEALGWPVPREELIAKLKIVAEERKNYDPEGARRVLEGSPRALFLNTEALSLEEEARLIRAFVARIEGGV
ncbi:MAG: AAA family ATPase [Meiothermus sp.]|nr:AAA family ATPase [Meiothermus sp.]